LGLILGGGSLIVKLGSEGWCGVASLVAVVGVGGRKQGGSAAVWSWHTTGQQGTGCLREKEGGKSEI